MNKAPLSVRCVVERAIFIPLLLLAGFFGPGCWTAYGDENWVTSGPVPLLDVAQPDAGSSDAAFSVDSSEGDATPSDAAPDAAEPSDASDSGPDADF